MKKLLFLFIIFTFCIISFQSASHGFSLNISPPSFNVSVEPGGSASGNIAIKNTGEVPTGITVYAEDWVYNEDGSKSFHTAGTKPFSCAKWIRLVPKKFRMEGGETISVQYTINVPEDAEGGYYAVIFFQSIPLEETIKEKGMVVQFAGRLGSIVYLDTKGNTARKGEIESLSVTPPQSDKPLEMTLSFKNTGNAHISANGTLNIIDAEGNVFGKKTFGPMGTLPGNTREAKAEWLGELDEGTYYTVVTLDIGTEEPIVMEKEITIATGGTIGALSVMDAASGKPSFSVLVKNTGHLNIDTGGRIDVLKENGEVVKSLRLKKSLIAPGKERKLKAVLKEMLPRGNYTARAVISIGTKEFTKEEGFSVK